jgi:hypothetical protein
MQKSFVCGAFAISALFAIASCATGPDEPAPGDPAQGSAEGPSDPTTEDASLLGMEIDSSDVVPDSAAQCEAGKFCLWQDSGFHGRILRFGDAGCQNLDPFGFNDQASSWYNHTHETWWVYWDANCKKGSKRFKAPPETRSSQMGGWNDNASAVCRGPSCQ